ncbi:MAG TPA: hypothetical protein VGD63_20725 [Steroidobacteraceae bacterium]
MANVDFCGIGKVAIDAKDPLANSHYLEGATEKTRARWVSSLLDSGNLRARAAGLFLQGAFTTDYESEQPDTQEARDELVRLAVGAADPVIYSMAVYRCNGYSADSSAACRQVSWDGWARMDPDNAVPWLVLAANAQSSNDPAAGAEAFNHAAKARQLDGYVDSLFAIAETELPKDASALERSFFAVQVIGAEAATVAPQYSIASKRCSLDAMKESGVKQQCNDVAELMVGKGKTVLDFAVGESIGKRVGWPAARLDALEQEKNAMLASVMQVAPMGDPQPWSCTSVARLNDWADLRSQLGEIGAARVLRERSGESISELARKHTEAMERIFREARESAQGQSPSEDP